LAEHCLLSFVQLFYPLPKKLMRGVWRALHRVTGTAMSPSLRIYYRLSDDSHIADRFASKRTCLNNFVAVFDRPEFEINFILDNMRDEEMIRHVSSLGRSVTRTSLGNARSYQFIMDQVCVGRDQTPVYFCEDDYLHLPDAPQLLLEGLTVGEYASVYDPGDKYVSAAKGGNPILNCDGEISRVMATKSAHWKHTTSTSMTFATTPAILRKHQLAWYAHSQGQTPLDLLGFMYLRQHFQTTIATCMPGRSTHVHGGWPGLFVDWLKVAKEFE
jgi:hypothetical protein